MLGAATLLVLLDSIAAGASAAGDLFEDISQAAAADRATLAALNDPDIASLESSFAHRAALVTASAIYPALQGQMLARALDVHYGGSGSLNRFLTANDLRIHPDLKKIGFQVDSINTFAPAVLDPVADYEGTDAGIGIFTAGSSINTAEYGEAGMEIIIEAQGAIERTVLFTMVKYDGSNQFRDLVIAGNAAPGSTQRIGGADDRYIGVARITTEGGAAGDVFRVRSIVERTLPPL